MKTFQEYLNEVTGNWWNKTPDDTSVYLVDKSKNKNYIVITKKGRDNFHVLYNKNGIDREFDGNMQHVKFTLRNVLIKLDGRKPTIELAKGEDYLDSDNFYN